MFRNGVECITGIIVFQDIVQLPEHQSRKEFADQVSKLPGKEKLLPPHTAEVMRQVKGANVSEGGWVGGDAWFGSVITAVEVMKQFGVFSTWIVKNNHVMYPKEALLAMLKVRYGTRLAGHWVTFR